jgi:excinuclease ABC subunit C
MTKVPAHVRRKAPSAPATPAPTAVAEAESGHAPDLAEVVASLPHLPGVYRMIGGAGEVLYVGKARDLKKRVASYFQKTASLDRRIQLMVAQVRGLETTITRSESEALLLENNLIKTFAPRYNILYRDDKSYPYLVLSGHPFPRLGFHRGALDKANRYFGPFSSAGAVRESIQLMQKVFRIRTCEDTVFSNRSRPCLLFQIKRCTGPCVGLIDATSYMEDVHNAELFLLGRDVEVLERLESKMEQASVRQDYEGAASYRDQIRTLRAVRQKQFVSSDKARDVDIAALVAEGGIVCVNLVSVRAGQHRGDKSFFPEHAEGYDATQALEAFLEQHYLNRDVPPLILVNHQIDSAALEELLSQQAGHPVQIAAATAGERRAWLTMAETNARVAIEQAVHMQSTQEGRLLALQQVLGLSGSASRLECFDISHTFGEATVGACVVYEDGGMKKSEYRRYNIHGAKPGDDYAAIRQVLDRRYRKVVAGEGKVPDLILIDGGKGQVSTAREAMEEVGLGSVPLIGVAKGEERKPGMEQLILPDRDEPLRLPPDHPALHLIQQVRDEAHRFAITGHRNRRARARRTSVLESITGIGAKRRQKLLSRFGGLRGLMAASVDEIAQVEGINRTLAERIYQELH